MPRVLRRSISAPLIVLSLLLILLSLPGGQGSLLNTLRPTAGAAAADAPTSCSSSGFVGAFSFTLLEQARRAVVADFNGDNKPDVVVPADSSNKLLVMLGNGAGSFSAPTTLATQVFPVSVAVADFNSDHKIDIVSANAISNSLSLFIGDGAGGFSAAINMAAASSGPAFIIAADFNRDQKADLAVTLSNGTIAIMLGDGSGSFTTTTLAAGGAVDLTTSDFNLDGNLDIAKVGGNQVSIFPGDGLGGFGPAMTFTAGPETQSLAPGDFNGDGKIDVAVTLYANKVVVLLNNGDGTLGAPTSYNVPGQNPTSSVAVGDFDNDGNTDLAGATVSFVSVWFGDGSGSFARQANYATGLGPTYLTIDDFNRDGSSDLIASAYSASSFTLFTNDGTGKFTTAAVHPVGVNPNSVLQSDFNNDGKLDLAAANRDSNDVSILLGDGTGTFAAARNFSVGPPPQFFTGNQPFSLAAGDFNGDSKTDLVTANFTGNSVSVLLGDGTGNFPSAQKINIATSPWYVAIGEFNSDGKLDLAVTGNGSNNVFVLLGDGNGNFGAPVVFSGLQGPRPIAIGDFNGDTKADIAAGNQTGTNDLVVLLGNGAGGFGAPTNYTLEGFAEPASIAIGDFNGDTKPDLIVAERGKDRIALLIGNGSGGFSAPAFVSVGDAPTGLAIADFNGDGFRDVAVANSNSVSVKLLFGNGSGGFSLGATYASRYATSVAAGDFNSDGRIDFATDAVDVFNSTCIDNAVTPPPDVTVNDPSVSEESGSITFSVILSTAGSQPVTVQYYTSGQSAASGADFQSTTGSVTFLAGETTKNVVVPILNDSINEFTERFSLNLHHPVNAAILKRQGTAAITDSDPEPSVTIDNLSVNEGNNGSAPAGLTLALSSPSGKLVTLSYATNDGMATTTQDYQGASGTVAIGAGATTKKLAIAVNGDTVVEPDETFFVNLSSPVNASIADAQGMVTIVDDDNTLQFSNAGLSFNENAGSGMVTVTRTSGAANEATVNYTTSDNAGANNCNVTNGAASSRCDYETTVGTLHFAAGENSKTIAIPIIDDAYAEGGESFTITLSNAVGATLHAPSVATVNINDNDAVNGANPIDQANFFVRQHYIDFLNREPDAAGLVFWSSQITECQQPGATCSAEVRRINVSAAFFLSIEFQETGYLVYRIYKTAYGNIPGTPVPITFSEFLPDTQQIGKDVIVGQPGWEQQLSENKVNFVLGFVVRARFATAYPNTMTPAEFVDALYLNAGVTPSAAERSSVISAFQGATTSADTTARSRALARVAENATLKQQETNRAFVLMQYFGYLRRNPNDAPEQNLNFDGYNFWLGKLNQFNGNFVDAEMVKAFIVSGEYRQRFGP